ncbi:MAG: chorismate mutase [Ignavibacterium sp.]|uniref:chorismate mutase n=1 Tax=Ignavibacterium sp. TaxID=2651167 RepID=UPI0032970DF3
MQEDKSKIKFDSLSEVQLKEKLSEYRKFIDEIDDELRKNLSARVDLIEEIAEIKKHLGSSTFDAKREEEIFNRISEKLEGNKLQYIQNVFERIIDESRSLQRKILGRK